MVNSGFQRVLLGLLLCVVCGLVGCAPSANGVFDDKGYQHTAYGYRVNAVHAPDPKVASENLLGNDWKVDNFYYDEAHNLAQKATEEYLTKYEFDVNGDGKADFDKQDFLYDLRFKHLKRDAVIWLRTMPLSDDLKEKDLRVLLQRYVDEVSGAGFEAVKLGPTTTIIREKRFAASVIERGPFKLAQQDAYETTFDVANVDEVAINPNARRTRVRIVLVRTPFEYSAEPDGGAAKPHKYAVLMLAGYANLPEDFATDEKDFQHLLEHTVIVGKRGTTAVALETSVSGAAPEAKPAALATPSPAASPAPASPAPASPAPASPAEPAPAAPPPP